MLTSIVPRLDGGGQSGTAKRPLEWDNRIGRSGAQLSTESSYWERIAGRVSSLEESAAKIQQLDDVVPVWHDLRRLIDELADVLEQPQTRPADIVRYREALRIGREHVDLALREQPRWVTESFSGPVDVAPLHAGPAASTEGLSGLEGTLTISGRYENVEAHFAMSLAIIRYIVDEAGG